MTRTRTLLLAAAIASAFTALSSSADASQVRSTKPPAGSTPLTNEQLYKLYSNRSWIWSNGAGYFAVKQRRFSAWSAEGHDSYGLGRWFLPDAGKLCFNAVWYAQAGKARASTCFSHRKKGNIVYQKREPDGDWYPFKTAAPEQNDEYRKVQPGDYVTARFNQIQAKLAQAK